MSDWVLEVTNPLTTGQRVKDMQWLLSGHNRFGKQTYHGKIDGIFGNDTAEAARDMKFFLGYATIDVTKTAGTTLRAYLLPKESPDFHTLPAAYLVRKKERARNLISYPLAVVGTLIGMPYQGTHTLGNWESDRACDISVPKSTLVLACFDGKIGSQFGPLDSNNPRLAGLRLHVVGEKDEAYYAHLSQFASFRPGDSVKAGNLIGYSGVANGVAHLHWALKLGWPPTFLSESAAL